MLAALRNGAFRVYNSGTFSNHALRDFIEYVLLQPTRISYSRYNSYLLQPFSLYILQPLQLALSFFRLLQPLQICISFSPYRTLIVNNSIIRMHLVPYANLIAYYGSLSDLRDSNPYFVCTKGKEAHKCAVRSVLFLVQQDFLSVSRLSVSCQDYCQRCETVRII